MPDHKRQEIEKLGLDPTPKLSYWTDTLFPALQTFHELHGHWRIPLDFRVLNQNPRWSETTWGMHLGKAFDNMRRASRDPMVNVGVSRLREFGCDVRMDSADSENEDQVLQLKRRCWVDQVAPSLATFERLHGHLDVLIDFQVPTDNGVWPNQSAGIQLGALVDRMTTYDVRKYFDLYTVDFPFRW